MQKHTTYFREFRALSLECEHRLVRKDLRLEHLEVLKAKLTDTHPVSADIDAITDAEKQHLALALDELFKKKSQTNAALVSAGAARKGGLEDAELTKLTTELSGNPIETTISGLAGATRSHLRLALGSLFDQLDDTAPVSTPTPAPGAPPPTPGAPAPAPASTPPTPGAPAPASTPPAPGVPATASTSPAEAPSVWAQRGQLAANTTMLGTGAAAASSIVSPTVASMLSGVGTTIAGYAPWLGTAGSAVATAAPWALGIGAPLWVLGKFSRGYQKAQLNSADVSAEEKQEIKKRLDRDWGVWFANDIHLGVETVYHLATAPIQNAIEGAGSMWHGALNWTGGAIKGAFNTVTAPLGKPMALLAGVAGAGAATVGVPAALAAAGGTVALGPVGLGIAAVAGGYMGYRWMKDYWYKSASAT